MVRPKTEKEIEILREAGRRLAWVLSAVSKEATPGTSTDFLNTRAEELIRAGGDRPAFLGYTPDGAHRPFPATLCVSVNDEVVHGIPTENPRVLKAGDIVGLDLGLQHRGLFVDSTITVPVGSVDEGAQQLIKTAHDALYAGIRAARAGARVGDISSAIEKCVSKTSFSLVSMLGGHGVGYRVHEEPHIPNVGSPGTGIALEVGMVLAIEPMVNEGTDRVVLAKDGYTWKTKDGKRSAHFEHTIVVTEGKPEVLTRI